MEIWKGAVQHPSKDPQQTEEDQDLLIILIQILKTLAYHEFLKNMVFDFGIYWQINMFAFFVNLILMLETQNPTLNIPDFKHSLARLMRLCLALWTFFVLHSPLSAFFTSSIWTS